MPHIRAAIFDLGNVLIDWDPYGHYRPHFETEEAMHQVIGQLFKNIIAHIHDEPHDVVTCLAPLKQAQSHLHHLIEIYETKWDEFLKGPIEGTVEILTNLRAQDINTYALTNWPHQAWPPKAPDVDGYRHHDYEFLDGFKDIIVSGIVQMRKPNADIYHLATDRFEIEPAQTVFVDDLAENVETANQLGFHGIQFTDPESLRQSLSKLGLSV